MTKNYINNTWKSISICLEKLKNYYYSHWVLFCFVLFYFLIYKGQGWKKYKIFGSLPLKSTQINERVVLQNAELYREPMHRSNTSEKKKMKLEFWAKCCSI